MIHNSMLAPYFLRTHRGFSILVALGTVGVLLIIVTGLATIYINEMKLSRMQYDNIIAYAGSEGAFEYALLKVKNHREWFADSIESTDTETSLLRGETNRTIGVDMKYQIRAHSSRETFPLRNNEHLILPLFIAQMDPINGSTTSKNPLYTPLTTPVTSIIKMETSASESDISWSIIAMKNGKNIGISGSGMIIPGKTGILRTNGIDCYDAFGRITICNGSEKEALDYFYDESVRIDTFLSSDITDPYLLVYNAGSDANISLETNTPFALPKLEVMTEVRKGNALQSIRFQEDKTRYYDALKYGIYNSGL